MDYRHTAFTIVAGLTVAWLGTGSGPAMPTQDQVLTGRVLDASGSERRMAVRLRCPGFQTQTWATESGLFSIRIPGLSDPRPWPASPSVDREPGAASFRGSRTAGTLDCTLQILTSRVSTAQFELAIPRSPSRIDLGELEVSKPAGTASDRRATIHWSSLAAPGNARAAFDEARRELSRGQPDLARADRFLEEALRLSPKMAEAWKLLGIVEDRRGHSDSARSAFETALRLDSASYESHTFLAGLDMREQKWREALEHCKRALEIEPNWLRAYYLEAFAACNLGDFEAAKAASRRVHARTEETRYADIAVVDSLLLAAEGKTTEAASLLRRFIARHPAYRDRSALEQQLRIWEK